MAKAYFVGAGPGAPDLITLRGRRLLDSASVVVYAGSLVNPALLEGIEAEVHDSAGMSLEETTEVMRKAVADGRDVVRLHTGDLSFYSAITEQIRRLRGLGIEYEVVPGVSSLAAGSAALETELTLPEVTQTVIVTRRAGRTPVPEAEALPRLAAHGAAMVIFLSVGMIEEVVGDLKEGGYADDTPVAVVEKASWPEERILRGKLSDIASKVEDAGIKKTALIYVGAAVGSLGQGGGTESKLYDKDFRHGYRK